MVDFMKLRHDMVKQQIYSRGVRDPLVLEAMRTVPREKFLPKSLEEFAYNDNPLPIDAEQDLAALYRCLHDRGFESQRRRKSP